MVYPALKLYERKQRTDERIDTTLSRQEMEEERERDVRLIAYEALLLPIPNEGIIPADPEPESTLSLILLSFFPFSFSFSFTADLVNDGSPCPCPKSLLLFCPCPCPYPYPKSPLLPPNNPDPNPPKLNPDPNPNPSPSPSPEPEAEPIEDEVLPFAFVLSQGLFGSLSIPSSCDRDCSRE